MTAMLRRLAVAFALTAIASGAAASSTAVGAAGSAAVRARAVSWAVKQVGTREIGTSNCSPVIDRWERQMGLKLPPCRVWCGAFVHQAFRQAGVQLSHRLIDVDRSYADAIAGRNGLRRIAVSQVVRGDILFYWSGLGKKASHLAIVRGRLADGTFATVEGNTHNAVRLKRRGMKDLVLAARVTGDA
jgi:hypothetical protein